MPGIGDLSPDARKARMAGTRPAMTSEDLTSEDLADGYHSQCVR
jgi:hypothetical protein